MGQGGGGLRRSKVDDEDDVVKRQVDSDDQNQKPIYQLVNVKNGGGKLIDLLKSTSTSSAISSSSNSTATFAKSADDLISSCRNHNLKLSDQNTHVDKQIRDLVEPLLYNRGRGKLVPLGHIWMYRLGNMKLLGDGSGDNNEQGQASDDNNEANRIQEDSSDESHRWVCWKLEERGFGGETALHICFLLSTPIHMKLARKLLTMFPMLINDIYLCDEYFGESSLHMAIVNEDVRIVKLLLDHGSNVHERCLGSFFLPGDQKIGANNIIRKVFDKIKQSKGFTWKEREAMIAIQLKGIDLQSNHFRSLSTNYDGYVYWGEYPLSFATCLGLEDCYKLLLAKGANPNKQDSNGNSSLHMAVISDRVNMFDLCYSSGADLNIVNKQNLTPLTLAAKLRRVDMFFHILKIQRQISWIFCNVGFVEVPLMRVDSINITDGTCDDDSVLSIVVFGGSNEHLQMLDGLLGQLLRIKWETSAKRKFYWWMMQFLMFLVLSSVAYITRFHRSPSDETLINPFELTQFDTSYERVCLYSECALICYVLFYLWVTIKRIITSVGVRAFFRTLAQAPEVTMFSFTCFLILTCIPLRIFNYKKSEDFMVALIAFMSPFKLLFFCRASKRVGSFVVMIYKIVVNDVLCFVVFLIIFVAGFSQSFLIMFKTHRPSTTVESNTTIQATDNNYFTNLFDGIISMHMMALNEFSIVFDEFESTDYPELAKLLFLVYMVIASILLINMLIAMLGKTYQDIASQPNESLRQWARALLIVERMWTGSERLEMLDSYSRERCLLDGGGRFFGTTWALTPGDKEEIDMLNRLGADNKRMSKRLEKLKLTGKCN